MPHNFLRARANTIEGGTSEVLAQPDRGAAARPAPRAGRGAGCRVEQDAPLSSKSSEPVSRLVALLELERARPRPVPRLEPAAARRSAARVVRRSGRGACVARRDVDRRRRPSPALAARLLPATGQGRRADDPARRPDPRRPIIHHPHRRRAAGRRGDLQPHRVVPQGRAGAAVPVADRRRRADAR